MQINYVKGENKGDILIYTLSTCVWCKKTKAFLNEMKLEYRYIDVDLLSPEEEEKAIEDIKKWNPSCSFPTVIINNKDSHAGFHPEKIKESLGL